VWDGCQWVPGGSAGSHPPPCPPCPPFPRPPLTGPIAGVTGNNAARPGEVGEFIMGTTTINIPVNAAQQTILAQPLIIPPGDWNVQAYLEPTGLFDAIILAGTPVPSGFSDSLQAFAGAFNNPSITFNTMLTTQIVQALVAVPTLVPFNIIVFNTPAAQTATVTVTGRRMR
jgi:hypothetical protein